MAFKGSFQPAPFYDSKTGFQQETLSVEGQSQCKCDQTKIWKYVLIVAIYNKPFESIYPNNLSLSTVQICVNICYRFASGHWVADPDTFVI